MTQITGLLTFAMIAFGLLSSCNPPASATQGSSVVILPSD